MAMGVHSSQFNVLVTIEVHMNDQICGVDVSCDALLLQLMGMLNVRSGFEMIIIRKNQRQHGG